MNEENNMNHLLENTAKFAFGTCFVLGAVTVAASIAAGRHVGKLVSAGLNGAKSAVEEELAKRKTDSSSAEETAAEAEVIPADFEN